jgi:hypothetical protein
MVLLVAGVLSTLWYLAEPWAVTFIDDGPYYSSKYPAPVARLPLHSQIELKRLGRPVFTLETRLTTDEKPNVFVLKDSQGAVVWAQRPVKPEGALGPIKLLNQQLTWYGGWKVRISPSLQEGGYLYLGTFGGFRFFNHSW